MSHIVHRSLRSVPPVAVGASGIEIIDREGRRYIDASGGAAVSCLGHAHPDVIAAMHGQLDRIPYAHTSFFTTDAAEELADVLVSKSPPGLEHVYLVSGGSEAIEAALKLARQYFVEIGEPERSVFIARRQSYHGNTLGALAVGGNEWRRREFEPLLMHVERVSPCFEYRERRANESQSAYTDRLIADEVMCGMGRTGTTYAIEQEAVIPDLVTIAKGLGGGYQPIGAVLAHKRIITPIREGSGFFQHGHTYIGHPMAAAAALAVQKVIERDHLLDAVRARGAYLEGRLQDAFGQHAHIGDLRGRGLFRGVELVADRATKAPFDPAHRLHARVKAAAMREGLCVYPMGGTIDGQRGDHVLLAPPLIVREPDIDEIVARLRRAIDNAISEVRREALPEGDTISTEEVQ